MRWLAGLGMVLVLVACSDGDGTASARRVDDAGAFDAGDSSTASDADVADAADAGWPSDAADDAPVTPPDPVAPCDDAVCWDTAAHLVRCSDVAIDEDFSSGNYNVHAYATRVHADAPLVASLERTGGAFAPAILAVREDGVTLSDGERGRVEPGLSVSVEADGRVGAQARLRIASDTGFGLTLYVTGWEVVDGGFAAFLPNDSTYAFSVDSECQNEVQVPCVVAGNSVAEPACSWLHYVAREVVPRLEGTRSERLTAAARVAWWSLKEGVLFLQNPIVYSNCNFTTGDARIGPLEVCASGRAWQVGLSGIQVPTYSLATAEATATRLFPELTHDQLLSITAAEANLDQATADAVVASTGDLRRSWLLRVSAVGFSLQEGRVTAECIDASLSWCYGTGWQATQLFAPDRATALAAIDDIQALLDQVAP